LGEQFEEGRASHEHFDSSFQALDLDCAIDRALRRETAISPFLRFSEIHSNWADCLGANCLPQLPSRTMCTVLAIEIARDSKLTDDGE
jgi:hypothetical protein